MSCTFSQRVFAEIRTFSSEFSVEPHVFLWMSLLREIFCTTFLKNRMSLTQPRQGQTVFRTKIARPTLCAHLVYGLQQADATPIIASSGSNTAPGAYLMSPFKKRLFRLCGRHLEQNQPVGTMHRNNVDLVLILFRHIVPSIPTHKKSPAHTKAACAGSFFYPRGLSNTSRM